jgi:hypothetical protein
MGNHNSLLRSLLQVLFGLVELFLQELNLPSQVLSGSPMSFSLVRSRLELLDLVFGLFDLGLGELEFMLKRSDFLVSFEKGLV